MGRLPISASATGIKRHEFHSQEVKGKGIKGHRSDKIKLSSNCEADICYDASSEYSDDSTVVQSSSSESRDLRHQEGSVGSLSEVMSAFTALNVEPDDNFDVDIDNTREIQIEEALKLYQSAIKLHSQGPDYYEQASVAYDTLFKSDIFKYPENITEFERLERLDEHPELELQLDQSFSVEAAIDGTGPNESESTIPQILYLSYKNYGQFIMDRVKHRMRNEALPMEECSALVTKALDNFVQAIARDESDTELWRRAARLASYLGSKVIKRYCLEAALEVDDDPALGEIEPLGLEEGFAGVQLREHLISFSDEVALSHPIMAPYNKKTMSPRIKRRMDPYPLLPQEANFRSLADIWEDQRQPPITITLPERSWCSLADVLLRNWMANPNSGAGVSIALPDGDIETEDVPDAPEDLITAHQPTQIQQDELTAHAINVPSPQVRCNNQGQVESVVINDVNTEHENCSASRKRSQSAAGIQDGRDEEAGTQKRSKRIRNRDIISTDGTPVDSANQFNQQLEDLKQTDINLFNFVGSLLLKLGVDNLGTVEELYDILSSESINGEDVTANTAVRDFRDILKTCDDNKASILMQGDGSDILGSPNGNSNAGLIAFLEHSKSRLKRHSSRPQFPKAAKIGSFVKLVNKNCWPMQDVVYEYLVAIHRSYTESHWPDIMKHVVYRLINRVDPEIFSRIQEDIKSERASDLEMLASLTQMLFEIHLDIYASITNPNSAVDLFTRLKEKDSLNRWFRLHLGIMQSRPVEIIDELALRFLWASVFHISMTEDVTREHIIALWRDLQLTLQTEGDPTIELHNNTVMPEVSACAAEHEISRLTTMDFFLNLFQPEKSNPVTIIQTLESIIDPQSVQIVEEDGSVRDNREFSMPNDPALAVPQEFREMWKFLQGGSTTLRLFLLQRLREAYQTIDYPTKVFSCYLKSIEIIMSDLRSRQYMESSIETRQHSLLSWLRTLDELVVKAMQMALLNKNNVYEIVDDAHIKSSGVALAQLCRLLHIAVIVQDNVRAGVIQLNPTAAFSAPEAIGTMPMKLREIQIRSWTLFYTLVKDGINQNLDLFPTKDMDLADFLTFLHSYFGLRKSCKVSNKIFVKMMKLELLQMKNLDPWEDYLGQVLYDLHGIRIGAGAYELQDHAFPNEPLDKITTIAIADRIIMLANRMPMKDLLKSELRPTIERMQQSVGLAKSNPQMLHNLRNYTEYIKGPIYPLRMFQAFRGQVCVDSVPVFTPESPLANKGWYFLLGMIALFRFRSQKRLGPGATDDLKVAASFFRLQLQFTSEHWETWYRLAQCFDAELEEGIMWSADKLNHDRLSLIQLQRSSIHCYVIALSTAMRSADASLDMSSKISDMCHDFGMRIYSSSREPFKMEAFYLDDFERFYSGFQGMYKKAPYEELTRYKAWRYANSLFGRALREKPNFWMSHYMRGKCLWKMYSKFTDESVVSARDIRPTMASIIEAFTAAIETVPKPKDHRQDPILEPHYKLISIVHKLVIRGDMGFQEAADLLQHQPYALRKGEHIAVNDNVMWGKFILDSIRHIRSADKANWHHRMIYRAASIVCPDNDPDPHQASAARAELKESMFTKTMVVQVWKPENERSGRHCVYMKRYVLWMIKLLWILEDALNMGALVKRVRKKQIEYYHFTDVWSECCVVYSRLLRHTGQIALNQDEALKTIPSDEVPPIADALHTWCNDSSSSHPALDCLREASELKKLNANLMKPAVIDDLINDAWATLFLQVGMYLPHAVPPPEPRSQGPMSLNNLVSNMEGSGTVSYPAPTAEATSRPRNKGISRREITRYAEAAVARTPEASRPFPASRSKINEQQAASRRNSTIGSIPGFRVAAALRDALREEAKEGEGESSAPGSVHDSADDESDLSDAPDTSDEVPIFPNLKDTLAAPGSEGGSGSICDQA